MAGPAGEGDIRAWLRAAIRPHPSITRDVERARATRAAAIVIASLVVGSLYMASLAGGLLGGASPQTTMVLALGVVALAGMLSAWGLLRRGRLNLAVGVLVTAIHGGAWALTWASIARAWGPPESGAILLSLVIAATLLTPRQLALFNAITVALFVATPFWVPVVGGPWALEAASYVIGAVVLGTFSTIHAGQSRSLVVEAAESRALLENTEALILSVDRSYTVMACNRRAVDAFDAAFNSRIGPGDNLLALLPPELHVRVATILADSLAGRRHDSEQALHLPDDQLWTGRVTTVPLRDDAGELLGATVHVMDLSARDDARRAEAERLRTARAAVINAASHELNTPLTPIVMQMSLLRGGHLGPVTDRQAEAMQVVQRNLDAMGQTVNLFLEVTRLEHDVADARLGPVAVGDLFSERPLRDLWRDDMAGGVRAATHVIGHSGLLAKALRHLYDVVAAASADPDAIRLQANRRRGNVELVFRDPDTLADGHDAATLQETADEDAVSFTRGASSLSYYIAERIARHCGGEVEVALDDGCLAASLKLPTRQARERRGERPRRSNGSSVERALAAHGTVLTTDTSGAFDAAARR